jgi:DNA-binding NarL/FixJ family response regulator
MRSRVVILTTFERDEYLLEALQSGANGFLLKNASLGSSPTRCEWWPLATRCSR